MNRKNIKEQHYFQKKDLSKISTHCHTKLKTKKIQPTASKKCTSKDTD